MRNFVAGIAVPCVLAMVGVGLLAYWVGLGPETEVLARIDGKDGAPRPAQQPQPRPPASEDADWWSLLRQQLLAWARQQQRPVPGEPVRSPGTASKIAGAWPWFRGPEHDAICHETVPLARKWPEAGPKRLWSVRLGEGYAAAAVSQGRVYVLDHVQDPDMDVLRCLSLDDGREIWHNGYRVVVPPYHGMSRTIPAVIGNYVITLGPMCQVACWDAETGKALWLIDLVLDYGGTVPEWYAGQCPLYHAETDQLILAVGGKSLLMAVDYKTGAVLWESANPRGWTMTHSSIMPMEFAGRRMYVYCGSGGVAGVAADDGEILWETTDWRVPMATCPSPVPIGDGRVFFCGGYNAGSLMLQVAEEGDRLVAKTLFRRTARQFSSEQQTPILLDDYLYGVRQHDKKLVCLDLEGKEVWNSGKDKFGSAPYLIADGLIYALSDEGRLIMAEATPEGYRPLGTAQVIADGVDSWGPMALVGGRLIIRDMTRMVCLDVSASGGG